MAVGKSARDRLTRGVSHVAIIVLVADLARHPLAAVIDRRLAQGAASSIREGEPARNQARLRTLLPILRNVTPIGGLVMAPLMALAALAWRSHR
jgi:moderate conductance mechanosensitive channel